MERHLGRKLAPGEMVHHLDLDKRNNDIANLHLCVDRAEHNGIHYSLQLAGAELYKSGAIVFVNGEYRVNE
jgi:hypothetical protein